MHRAFSTYNETQAVVPGNVVDAVRGLQLNTTVPIVLAVFVISSKFHSIEKSQVCSAISHIKRI